MSSPSGSRERWVDDGPLVTVVGEAPGRRGEATAPLRGRSGETICRLAGVASLAAFRVVNLLGFFPGSAGKGAHAPRAAFRAAWMALEPSLSGAVLLLGKRVGAAAAARPVYLEWERRGRYRLAIVPHPSGINRWWNDESNRTEAERFFRALRGEKKR